MISVDNPGTRTSLTGNMICNLCQAIANGNATCWACVERWTGGDWTELVTVLRKRTPGPPTGPEEISEFVEKLEPITSQPPAPTRRPFKPDQHRVNRGDWRRASGLTICAICHFPFADHADVRGYEWLQRFLRATARLKVTSRESGTLRFIKSIARSRNGGTTTNPSPRGIMSANRISTR